MKKTKYSTKSICDIFGITRETLRHYERLGLLNPYINPENGYREYSYWDVGALIDTLKYRSLGFSLADAKDALFNFDYPKIVESLEAHTEYFTNQIIQYTLLRKKALKDLEYLRFAKDHMNEIAEGSIEDFLFIPYTIDSKNKYFPPMQKAFAHSQFFTTALVCDNEHEYPFGLMTEKKYADFLNITDGIIIKGSPIVCHLIDIEGRDRVDEGCFDEFKAEISKRYSRVFDTIYALLVSRFYDKEKRYHQYFFVFAKLD